MAGREEPSRITGHRLTRRAPTTLTDNGARIDAFATVDGDLVYVVFWQGAVAGIAFGFIEAFRLARGFPRGSASVTSNG